jgi:hypothetical protein
MSDLQFMKPLIQDPNDQNTLSKTIVLSSRIFFVSNQQLFYDLIYLLPAT